MLTIFFKQNIFTSLSDPRKRGKSAETFFLFRVFLVQRFNRASGFESYSHTCCEQMVCTKEYKQRPSAIQKRTREKSNREKKQQRKYNNNINLCLQRYKTSENGMELTSERASQSNERMSAPYKHTLTRNNNNNKCWTRNYIIASVLCRCRCRFGFRLIQRYSRVWVCELA